MNSKLFNEWFDISQIAQGRKVRGTILLRDFKQYCNGRHATLSSKKFYEMLRSHSDKVVAENKKSGWWFRLEGVGEIHDDPKPISWKQLMAMSDEYFVDFIQKNKKMLLESKYIYTGRLIRDFGLFTDGKKPTIQEFNRWLRMAGLFLTGYEPYIGRNKDGKIIKFK